MSTADDAETLARILVENPTLAAQVTRDGAWFDAQLVEEFRRAMAFLEVAPRRKTVNFRTTCYDWKHVAEAWTQRRGGTGYYISEVSFIAACIAKCLLVKRDEAGRAYTNLASRGIDISRAPGH